MRILQAPASPTRVVSAIVTLLLLAPPVAIAQAPQTKAPAGNSGIAEYLETIPGATGDRTSKPPPAAGGGGPASSALTPAQRTRLERLGPDGKALADVVDSTSPSGATPRKSTTAQAPSYSARGRSPLSEVFDAAVGRDGGGMGVLLPAILAATVLGVGGLVLIRRRSIS